MSANYIYETNAIKPEVLDAIFARVTSGESFTTLDLREVYRAAHPMVDGVGYDEEGEAIPQLAQVGPSHADLGRIIRALRETHVITPIPGPSGRVTWGLDTRRPGYIWKDVGPLPVRLNRARAILSEGTPPAIPTLGKNSTARELAAKQIDTIGAPDISINPPKSRTFDELKPVMGFRGFRGVNETADSVPSALEALPPFKRVVETLKVIVGETVAKVVFDLRGVQDRDLEDIREASPDDKLRWANRHTPGIVIPTPNQQWSHRPNVPSIVLPIPV